MEETRCSRFGRLWEVFKLLRGFFSSPTSILTHSKVIAFYYLPHTLWIPTKAATDGTCWLLPKLVRENLRREAKVSFPGTERSVLPLFILPQQAAL